MQPDEMFMKVVQKLQRDGLLNSRRKFKFEYAGDEETIEKSTAEQVGVNRRDVLYSFENYASATVYQQPMARYLSSTPKSSVNFSAELFKVYFPIGRSGMVEVILDTIYLNPDNKVTERDKKKIEKIEKELREEFREPE